MEKEEGRCQNQCVGMQQNQPYFSTIFYRFDNSYTRTNHYVKGEKQVTHNEFITSLYHGHDYDWYFDIGARNHVTCQTCKF